MTLKGQIPFRATRSRNANLAQKHMAPFLATALVISGCAGKPHEAGPLDDALQSLPTTTYDHEHRHAVSEEDNTVADELTVMRKIGTGKFLNSFRAEAPELINAVSADGNEFDVNIVNAPIEQAVSALLGDTLGLNYMIAPNVTGNVTIRTTSPLNRAALFDAFQNSLELSGFSIRREQDTFIVSGHGETTRRFLVGTNSDGAAGGVHVIPLKYIAAAEMVQILQPIAVDALQMSFLTDRNLILISGARDNIEAALDAVKLFDTDIMKGKSVSRVELTSADPTAVALELAVIFDTVPGGALSGVIEFIPNNVLGSILIVSSNAQYTREAENWIKEYENAVRTEIYELRNRSASDLSGVLSALLADGSRGGGATAASPAAEGPLQPGSAAPSSQGAGVTIVADETANAIIVHATASKQREVERLINRLDDVADQVLIEAMIAEVQLNDSLDFGVRHFFESGNFTTNFSGLVSGGASALFPGANAVFSDGGTLTAAIDALSSITEVNIISSPSLLVLDNREAILNVGDQVPVVTQTSSSVTDPDAPIINAVSYRDTGVILRVRPRVDNSGRVILDINQEVSDAVTTETSEIDAPTIQQRSIATTVAVDDGQSLLLGGLIRETNSNTRAKVPLLGDVPLLGAPFRRTETSSKRTELLVIITPRVVRNPIQARAITEEYKLKLSSPGALMHEGGHDVGSVLKRIVE